MRVEPCMRGVSRCHEEKRRTVGDGDLTYLSARAPPKAMAITPFHRAGVIPTPYGGVPSEPLPCPAWGHQRTEDRDWVRGALKTHTQ